MALTTGAVAMLLFACFILYGGLLYFMLIAMRRDPIMMLPDPLRGFFMVPWNRYGTVLLVAVILIIPALTSEGLDEENGGYSGGPSSDDIQIWAPSESGHLDEGEIINFTYEPDGYAKEAWFNLTWTDEPDSDPILYQNEGDTFTLRVVDPMNDFERSEQVTNDHGESGEINFNFDLAELTGIDNINVGGQWLIEITLDEAGDQSWLGIGSGIVIIDDGNDYDLDMWFKYVE